MADTDNTTTTNTTTSTTSTDTTSTSTSTSSTTSSSTSDTFKDDLLDSSYYSIPSVDEYYINAVDYEWYSRIVEAYNNKDDMKDLIFYQETPPILDPGYYSTESVYVIQPTDLKSYNQDKDIFLGYTDGDTLHFSVNNVECGDEATQALVNDTAALWTSTIAGFQITGTPTADIVDVRTLCVDCPEVPHISVLSQKKAASDLLYSVGLRTTTISEISEGSNYSYIKYECTDNSSSDKTEWTFEARNPQTEITIIEINGNY